MAIEMSSTPFSIRHDDKNDNGDWDWGQFKDEWEVGWVIDRCFEARYLIILRTRRQGTIKMIMAVVWWTWRWSLVGHTLKPMHSNELNDLKLLDNLSDSTAGEPQDERGL